MEKTEISDVIGQRRAKLAELLENNIKPFPNDIGVLHTIRDMAQ